MSELKPCPFCGAEPPIYDIEPHKHAFCGMPDHPGSTVIECGCGLIDESRERVIKRWNTRTETSASASTLAKRVAELERERDEARRAESIAVAIEKGVREWRNNLISASEALYGPGCLRLKISLDKRGKATNLFPSYLDGRWVAFQYAEDDGHIGLVERLQSKEAEVERLRECLLWVQERHFGGMIRAKIDAALADEEAQS